MMFSIKQELVKTYHECKSANNLTSKKLAELSGLSEVQINYILKHEAKKVSVEKLEIGLNNMGFYLKSIVFFNKDNTGE